MKALPAISRTWAEGRYFDLWMLVHFASGLAGGFSNVHFGLTTAQVFGLAIALMLLWELLELTQGVHESVSNRVLDIIVGLAGVWLALVIAARISDRTERIAFAVTTTLAVAGLAFGARARRRRTRSASPARP
jgi:glycopeptide antibiotics resistance protein